MESKAGFFRGSIEISGTPLLLTSPCWVYPSARELSGIFRPRRRGVWSGLRDQNSGSLVNISGVIIHLNTYDRDNKPIYDLNRFDINQPV